MMIFLHLSDSIKSATSFNVVGNVPKGYSIGSFSCSFSSSSSSSDKEMGKERILASRSKSSLSSSSSSLSSSLSLCVSLEALVPSSVAVEEVVYLDDADE